VSDEQCLAIVAAILAMGKQRSGDAPRTYHELAEQAHELMTTARDVVSARADVRARADAERTRWLRDAAP
jgi:hypothetical protein